ncbi:hypothetical protein RISK_002463 [Rhodopirellula islandica]|uniref:Uncharacterized protein n=1 Tax=Rhodopirellula islandica TaxID=595434 RepID=A0A0J1BH27_RHOIS|nr:hypothetical protein RISK_002463 [Rhodopirellula islandica]
MAEEVVNDRARTPARPVKDKSLATHRSKNIHLVPLNSRSKGNLHRLGITEAV